MRKLTALLLAAAAMLPAAAQAQVGVSIGINQPGVYGRINIGEVPPPALILHQPVIIEAPRVAVPRRPIYLYVPPAHQRDWRRYCDRYGACGQPVYFVRDEWVRERYAHEHPGWDRGRHRGWDKDDQHGKHDKHDKKEKHYKEKRDKHHGKGHGKGRDH